LDALTRLGEASLSLPGLPPFDHPDVAQFGWAMAIGVLAAVAGSAVRWCATVLRAHIVRRTVLRTPVVGLAVAGLASAYTSATGNSSSDVLFSGEAELGPLLQHSAGYSVPALLMLVVCKGVAYSLSLSSFRGGPVFPAMFIGAAGGIALSHLPGLPVVAGVAMGIGAMCVVLLRLPLTSVLLATLLLSSRRARRDAARHRGCGGRARGVRAAAGKRPRWSSCGCRVRHHVPTAMRMVYACRRGLHHERDEC
jgi:hypothetical protein